jgi:predicted mannosyl-3-phosphoglycerate phosphatase (HAD superfamily)
MNKLYNSRNQVVWEMTAQERAAKVVYEIATGSQMTTEEVAEITGLTKSGAWWLMQRVIRVTPIGRDDNGRWGKVE